MTVSWGKQGIFAITVAVAGLCPAGAQNAQPTPTPQRAIDVPQPNTNIFKNLDAILWSALGAGQSPALPISFSSTFSRQPARSKYVVDEDRSADTWIGTAPAYDEIVVTAVGDVMLGTTFPDDSPLPPNDGAGLLDEVTPLLKRGDVVFGNLEGPLVDTGESAKCKGQRA